MRRRLLQAWCHRLFGRRPARVLLEAIAIHPKNLHCWPCITLVVALIAAAAAETTVFCLIVL